jgi:hypothetical protein
MKSFRVFYQNPLYIFEHDFMRQLAESQSKLQKNKTIELVYRSLPRYRVLRRVLQKFIPVWLVNKAACRRSIAFLQAIVFQKTDLYL